MHCIRELAALLTKRAPDETVLLVRNLEEGQRLLTECTGSGALLVGVRVLTPLLLARGICAPLLARKDAPHLLSRSERQDLFFRCLLEHPAEGFFARPHVRERKTAEMLLDCIDELNRELSPPLTGNERLEAIEALRESWQRRKGAGSLDESDLLHAAIERVQTGEYKRDTAFVVLSTEIFPRLDRKLIETVAGERLTVFPVAVPEGARVPEACMGQAEQRLPIRPERLRFWRCRGEGTEQQAILRHILSTGQAAEDCAVVYLNRDAVPGLQAAAALFHLPIRMAEGVPLSSSSVVDVLRFVQSWAASDYNAEDLRRLVLSGAVKIERAHRFCRALRKKNVGWGESRYALILEPDEDAFPDRETAENWQHTLELLFRAAQRTGTPEEQRQALQQLLSEAVGVSSTFDANALALAKELLAGISWLDEGETVLDRLTELTEAARAGADFEESGSILALPLEQAFCTGRKMLYVCGLARFSMQGDSAESPLLLDEERKALGLAAAQEKELRTSFRFLLNLAQHEGEAVLSYSDFDMERMNPLSPTPVYRELLGSGKAEAISCVVEEALTVGDVISTGRPVRIQAPDAGTQQYDSYQQRLEEMAFSPTQLETALACPFKFYMGKLVGLKPPFLPERRNDSWLEPNELGNLCHTVLERVYREQGSDWESILEDEFQHMRESRPESLPSAMQADRDKAAAMIARALAWTENAEREVAETEKGFGRSAGEEPITIPIGERSLRLSGSIDRIDRMGDGTLAILDYKTGKADYYRDNLDTKLQQYLYTRAAESLWPGESVSEGGYLFLKDAAEYLGISQNAAERERKEKTILSLLDWIAEESRCTVAAPAFLMAPDGSIVGTGNADAREKEYNSCRKRCEFAALCPAQTQINRQRERELEAEKESEQA